jgi:membrane-associated PAP2 superfamily phosphatase
MHPFLSANKLLARLCAMWSAFFILAALIYHYDIDFLFADQLFFREGGSWTLKHHVLTETVLHDGGRLLSETMGVIAISGFILCMLHPRLRNWRRATSYLVFSVLLSTVSVSVIKHLISMDCPWDLARYGGDLPFIGLLDVRPAGLPDTACFPAGHASAGYAWIALYFFFQAVWPRGRWPGLATGLLMGLIFGFAQQLRGAHFLSHDLWTLMICWTISLLLAQLLLRHSTTTLRLPQAPDVPSTALPRLFP